MEDTGGPVFVAAPVQATFDVDNGFMYPSRNHDAPFRPPARTRSRLPTEPSLLDMHVAKQAARVVNLEFLKTTSVPFAEKLMACSQTLNNMCIVCDRMVDRPSFFGKIYSNRGPSLGLTADLIRKLALSCFTLAKHVLTEDHVVGWTLCVFDLEFLFETMPSRLLFLQYMFEKFETLYAHLDTLCMTVMKTLPELFGLPISDDWSVECCIKAAVNTKHELIFCGEAPSCAICQEAFADGDTIMRFSRGCKHDDPTESCSGPICTCKSALHPKCVALMIRSGRNRHSFRTCPTCRAEFCVKDLTLKTVFVPLSAAERSEAGKRLLEITKAADAEAEVSVSPKTPDAPKRLKTTTRKITGGPGLRKL